MDISSIQESLARTPSLIEQAAIDVSEKKQLLDHAKREVEKAKALATINNQNAKNQAILNALVERDSAVDAAEAEVIKAHAAYLIAVSKHERQKDEFDAAKKNANLIEAEMRSFSGQRHSPSDR